jgi:AGCS family alanine or glycine:cation symporter
MNFASRIDVILWGPWTMAFIAAVAFYLSLRSRFFQFYRFGFILSNTFGKIFSRTQVAAGDRMTPFQATTTALASTVGMGNIAGVATALSVGGAGAIFWMWILALAGMMTKTAEITLAVHYREVDGGGALHGGPMYYIRKGLGWSTLAKIFSAGVLVNSVFTASLVQAHTVGRAFLSSYGLNPYLVTSLMGITTAVVVIGGVKRIGKFCEKMVPLMSLIYILGGMVIFLINYGQIPDVFSMIFRYAFAPMPAVGGFAGVAVAAAIKEGMAKGMLSNEAGLGTAPMVHATADTEHPFQQGLWGAFEVFVDTIVICTITSFALLSTGVLSTGESGIELIMLAFSQVFTTPIANTFISICILTFCLTTQIGFFIYYQTAIIHLFGKWPMRYLKWFYFIPAIIFAGVADVNKVWVFTNIAVGVCAIPNLVAVLALSGVFFVLMQDYLQGTKKYATAVVDRDKNYIRAANSKSR